MAESVKHYTLAIRLSSAAVCFIVFYETCKLMYGTGGPRIESYALGYSLLAICWLSPFVGVGSLFGRPIRGLVVGLVVVCAMLLFALIIVATGAAN